MLDPAFAPGTGTPEPGGMTAADLLWACRHFAEHTQLVGADLVEVIPTGVAPRTRPAWWPTGWCGRW